MLNQSNIRALTINEILDKALRIYRANFAVLLGIVAIALIPQGIFEFVVTLYPGNVQGLRNSPSFLFSTFATLALIVAISNIYMDVSFSFRLVYFEGVKKRGFFFATFFR